MDDFSLIVLERTLELATEAIPQHESHRVSECVDVIRRYMKLIVSQPPDSEAEKKLLQEAVTELLDIADRNRQFLIAIRLKPFARQLGPPNAAA